VDVYTLQLLYVFVESLAIAQGDDPSLGKLITDFYSYERREVGIYSSPRSDTS
jgi:hypothetical protein